MIDKLISDLSCATGYLVVALLVIGIAILVYGIFIDSIFSLQFAIPALAFLIAGVLVTLIATENIILDWWHLSLVGDPA